MLGESTGIQNTEMQVTCFQIGEVLCGIDIRYVQEINKSMNITQVPLSQEYIKGIMNLRGDIVTVIDLGKKLGMAPVKIDEDSRITIVKWNDEFVGLLVDRIYDVISVQKQDIMPPPSNIKGAKGKYFQGVIKKHSDLIGILEIDAVLEVT